MMSKKDLLEQLYRDYATREKRFNELVMQNKMNPNTASKILYGLKVAIRVITHTDKNIIIEHSRL